MGGVNHWTILLAPELQIVTDFIDLLLEGLMVVLNKLLARNDLSEAAKKQKSTPSNQTLFYEWVV